MTLWSIARSPLIFGGDMTKLDDFTLSLITNPEVIAVDQASANNRQLFRRDGSVAWVADVPGSRDKYLAVFNTASAPNDAKTRQPAHLRRSRRSGTLRSVPRTRSLDAERRRRNVRDNR